MTLAQIKSALSDLAGYPMPLTHSCIYALREKLGLHSPDNLELRVNWINHLRTIVSRRMPRNKAGSPVISDVDLFTATEEEHAEAVLRTMKKWKVNKS